MRDELTRSELVFLASQGLGPEDVFDARWMSQPHWFREIKEAGKTIALGSACRKAGHRLRSRKGHCAQCDTKVLAYAGRYDLEQHIYIAGSLSARLVKIGVCKNLLQRERQICSERHGNATDWEVIYAVHIARSGEIEERVLHRLARYSVDEHYWKNGGFQKSIELRRCSISEAVKALNEEIEGKEFYLAIDLRDKSAHEFVQR